MHQISRLHDQKHILGESPLWDHRTGVLWWIDSLACELWQFDPANQQSQTYKFDQKIGSVGLRKSGGLILAMQSGVYGFDPDTEALTFLVDPEPTKPNNRLNDGRVGPDGRFWIGSHCDDTRAPTAGLYCVDHDLSVTEIDNGLTIANGVAISSDKKNLLYADTPAQKIYRREISPTSGKAGPRQVFHDLSGSLGRPDGAAIDTDGNYWCALVRDGAIGCFDPSGALIKQIEVPTQFPTMCAFGGPGLGTMFVTSTLHLIEHEGLAPDPNAGFTFCIEGLEATGVLSSEFLG